MKHGGKTLHMLPMAASSCGYSLMHGYLSKLALTYQGLSSSSFFDFFFSLLWAQFAFSVIVKQVLGLSPEEPVTAMILEDFLTFMKGLISFPLRIPGTPYAKAVQVIQ